MPTIVFLDTKPLITDDIDTTTLSQLGHLICYSRTTQNQILDRCASADIILSNKVVLSGDILANLPNLKLICVAATGYNNIDVQAAKSLGIPVCNVKGYSTPNVAQHVFAFILDYYNRISHYNSLVHQQRWAQSDAFAFFDHPIRELQGKTLGIYGYGHIGQTVHRIAMAFGMKVIIHTRTPKLSNVEYVDWSTLCKTSDIITLHAAMDETNKHIINQQSLSMMHPKTLLINTGRGGLINEKELLDALEQNLIGHAFLDVLSVEPPPLDHPLTKHPKCTITPHIAWASVESRQKLVDGLVKNIKAFFNDTLIPLV